LRFGFELIFCAIGLLVVVAGVVPVDVPLVLPLVEPVALPLVLPDVVDPVVVDPVVVDVPVPVLAVGALVFFVFGAWPCVAVVLCPPPCDVVDAAACVLECAVVDVPCGLPCPLNPVVCGLPCVVVPCVVVRGLLPCVVVVR